MVIHEKEKHNNEEHGFRYPLPGFKDQLHHYLTLQKALAVPLYRAFKKYTSVQLTSVAQLSPNRCNPMDCSTPSFPVHHQLLDFTQIHIH